VVESGVDGVGKFICCWYGSVTQKQLACILGRQQVFFELADDYSELMDLMRNSSLNTHFINLARELDILEPKVPEDIYKSHLEPNSESCIYVGQILLQACHVLLLEYMSVSAEHFKRY